MKNKKYLLVGRILIVGLIVGAIGFHQLKFSEIPVWKVPKLLSAMRAKEFCSCHFVLNFKRDYCLKKVVKGYPIFDFELDPVKKIVRFENPFAASQARLGSLKTGCSLQ